MVCMDRHAYGVTGYNASSSTFTLYNPWGFDQPPAGLTWADLMATTDVVTVANTSGSVPISSTPISSGIVQATVAAAGLAAARPIRRLRRLPTNRLRKAGFLPSHWPQRTRPLRARPRRAAVRPVGANATRALFDRLGTDSGTLTFTRTRATANPRSGLPPFPSMNCSESATVSRSAISLDEEPRRRCEPFKAANEKALRNSLLDKALSSAP